jgi:Major intrinsic protein
MVNARFGGQAVPYAARVVSPALMVMAVILFMGAVSGARLNPAVSIAFALRGDFPCKRVPAYIVAQFVGAILATLLLWAPIGKQGSAGLTLPGRGRAPRSVREEILIMPNEPWCTRPQPACVRRQGTLVQPRAQGGRCGPPLAG